MPIRRLRVNDEWQLGSEPPADQELAAPSEPEPKANLSTARLARPVQVLTVEHLAWGGIVIWAVITRLLQLGMAPLAPAEARHALFEYDLVNRTDWASAAGYHPAWAGWLHLAEAGLFATGGASDYTARLIFALAGLVIIVAAFFMRPYLGRAGAIAAAGLITISPTFTYFSRTSAMAIVAAALVMIMIQTVMALTRRPGLLRSIELGCAGGLLCTVEAAGFAASVVLLVALAMLAACQLMIIRRAFLNVRIWLVRYTSALVAAVIAAGLCWLVSEMSLFRPAVIAKSMENVWNGFAAHNYLAGLQYYATSMVLYDFLIILTAITGVIAIIMLRAWSRLGLFCLLWLVLSFGYFLGVDQREPERLVFMLLPLVIVGALGIDYLHHTRAWPYMRLALVVLGVATVYVQVEANFIYAAPDVDEASWARHANLYWRDGATPVQARTALQEIRRRFPEQGGMVFNSGLWQPSLRWYLRDFRPTSSAKLADLVISPKPFPIELQASELESRDRLELEESWQPTLTGLTPARIIRFMLAAIAWAPLQRHTITIAVLPRLDLAPTVIIPPLS